MWVKGQSPFLTMREGAVYADVNYRWMKVLVSRGVIQGWRVAGSSRPVLVSRAECLLYQMRKKRHRVFSWGFSIEENTSYGKQCKRNSLSSKDGGEQV